MRLLAAFAWISLLLATVGAAHGRILGETGREMIAPDGRTLIDKEHGFSIVLPAPDWKVHLFVGEGTEMTALCGGSSATRPEKSAWRSSRKSTRRRSSRFP